MAGLRDQTLVTLKAQSANGCGLYVGYIWIYIPVTYGLDMDYIVIHIYIYLYLYLYRYICVCVMCVCVCADYQIAFGIWTEWICLSPFIVNMELQEYVNMGSRYGWKITG